MDAISYGKQFISDSDIEKVVEALKSGWITQGIQVDKFENLFSEYIGVKHSISCANGTAALFMAVNVLKNSKKKVITTPNTFVASANCVVLNGLGVDFVDIDEKTGLMDFRLLEEKLQQNPNDYQGVIPVTYSGLPLDLEKLKEICDKYGLWILEDACHSPGGAYLNSQGLWIGSGSCTDSDVAIFSFHPVKHLTTGEGGMVTCSTEKNSILLKQERDHGLVRNKENYEVPTDDPWFYEMQRPGFNFRLTDIQAALGIGQLERAHENSKVRARIAGFYQDKLRGVGDIEFQEFDEERFKHAYHLFVLRTEKRRELFHYLLEKNIRPQVHYIPVHLHPYYKRQGFHEGMFPKAEVFYKKCISIPMYPTLRDEELEYVVDTIKGFYS